MPTLVNEEPGGKLLASLNVSSQEFLVNGTNITVIDSWFLGLRATTINRRSSLGKLSTLELYPKDGLVIAITDEAGTGIKIRRTD